MARIGEVREMRNAETELGIIQACLEVVTGERLKIERLTSRSEGGGWKSACQDNSLAAYLTASAPWGPPG